MHVFSPSGIFIALLLFDFLETDTTGMCDYKYFCLIPHGFTLTTQNEMLKKCDLGCVVLI